MRLFYSFIIHTAYFAALIISPFHTKVRQWVKGRIGWRKKLKSQNMPNQKLIWFHAASLGEFEQGKPLIEAIKKKYPGFGILLTFFSPSGYEVRKNYMRADMVSYLPLDTSYNARLFILTVRPDVVFFIKYDLWYYYLKELSKNSIPVYLISAKFRKEQIFFRSYGWWFKNKLSFLTHIFVQDNSSATLLKEIGFDNVIISGDTRFDQVMITASSNREIDKVRLFAARHPCLIAGSTWPEDERLLVAISRKTDNRLKLIIAPHEISDKRVNHLISTFKSGASKFSDPEISSDNRILIIDNVGMLSSLYKYGIMAYIGGGFGKGIHNLLEPASAGLPVIFGPRYHKFNEALDMIQLGGAFPVNNHEELYHIINKLLNNADYLTSVSALVKNYVTSNTGATEKILGKIRM